MTTDLPRCGGSGELVESITPHLDHRDPAHETRESVCPGCPDCQDYDDDFRECGECGTAWHVCAHESCPECGVGGNADETTPEKPS